MESIDEVIKFIKELFDSDEILALHQPVFMGNEKRYLNECIDTTFVSSVGKFVDRFENMIKVYTGAKYAIASVNGTAGLHVALKLVGVQPGTEVITQPLTFVATCNAIRYCDANPIFVDVDIDTMGLSPNSLQKFIDEYTEQRNGYCFNKKTGNKISAVLPMHTFGRPCRIKEIAGICKEFNLALVEDAAESLGSYYQEQHTGTFGEFGVFSFNGNKVITSGGGGMIVTNDPTLAKKAKHITTTAKLAHPYEFIHDDEAFNYRLPNINAALGCAQMESLDIILDNKRHLAEEYNAFFEEKSIVFAKAHNETKQNHWLNAILLENKSIRDDFLKQTNDAGVMTRPIWRLMNKLKMFNKYHTDDLENALWLEERVVNIPSGARF